MLDGTYIVATLQAGFHYPPNKQKSANADRIAEHGYALIRDGNQTSKNRSSYPVENAHWVSTSTQHGPHKIKRKI
jgi:hypothetical protein